MPRLLTILTLKTSAPQRPGYGKCFRQAHRCGDVPDAGFVRVGARKLDHDATAGKGIASPAVTRTDDVGKGFSRNGALCEKYVHVRAHGFYRAELRKSVICGEPCGNFCRKGGRRHAEHFSEGKQRKPDIAHSRIRRNFCTQRARVHRIAREVFFLP